METHLAGDSSSQVAAHNLSSDSPPSNNQQLTRRTALKALGTSAMSFSIVPRAVLGGPGFVPPSEMIQIGMIGCGGRARQNLKGVLKHKDARVVAVADPAATSNSTKLKIYRSISGRVAIQKQVEDFYKQQDNAFVCNGYEDFREMLDLESDIDAVVISTPDHQHAHATVHAMRAGKHVYCEKPLTHNIREARIVRDVARETGVATQMGNQGHSKPSMAETVERVWAGQLGNITEVHAWVPARRWNPELVAPPTEAVPIPAGLNWDLWLGPRQTRPFHPAYAPVHWRDFWDFGCGALGDFACHDLDSATWSLDLDAPTHVEAFAAGKTHEMLSPHGSICRFDFPANSKRGPIRVTWYDGGLMPELPEAARPRIDEFRRGVMFVGDEGHMLCQGAGGPCWVLPKGESAAPPAPEPSIRRVEDHYRDWLDACKGGPHALGHYEYASRLTETTLLGVLALRLGQRIEWDAKNARVVNNAKADALIHGDYRPGWEVTS